MAKQSQRWVVSAGTEVGDYSSVKVAIGGGRQDRLVLHKKFTPEKPTRHQI